MDWIGFVENMLTQVLAEAWVSIVTCGVWNGLKAEIQTVQGQGAPEPLLPCGRHCLHWTTQVHLPQRRSSPTVTYMRPHTTGA